jgi:hypothetical protein
MSNELTMVALTNTAFEGMVATPTLKVGSRAKTKTALSRAR